MVRGLSNVTFQSNGDGNNLQLKDGDTKQIRFLQEGDEIEIYRRHWVNLNGFKGFVICLNNPEEGVFDNCPLCDRAGGWGAPISAAGESLTTVVVDRSDGKVKALEVTKSVIEQLAKDYTANGTIIDVDYSLTRQKVKKGKSERTEYNLDSLRNTASQLTDDEKAMRNQIDISKEVSRMRKTKEEILDILKTPINQNTQQTNNVQQQNTQPSQTAVNQQAQTATPPAQTTNQPAQQPAAQPTQNQNSEFPL